MGKPKLKEVTQFPPIHSTPKCLEVDVKIVYALLEFAYKTPDSAGLCGIGIDAATYLSASDGCTALRWTRHCGALSDYKNKFWPRYYCETQLKVAKAINRPVALAWNEFDDQKFLDVNGVFSMTPQGIRSMEPVGIDPAYLSRLTKVTAAFDRPNLDNPQCVALMAAAGPMDPILFEVRGKINAHPMDAEIVIMPYRL